MTKWTRLATATLTVAGLVGLGNEAAAQCVTLHSGTPTMIVLANPISPQATATTTTTAQGTTTTTQGTVTTAQGTTTVPQGTNPQTVTPAGGVILSDGRIVPAADVAGRPSYYTPGAALVDGNGNPIAYPPQVMGSSGNFWPNGMYSNGYVNGSGMYVNSPYVTYWDTPSERPRRGLFRRR
jgi:hypothetical protein